MRSGSLRGRRLLAGLVAPLALYAAAAGAQSTPVARDAGRQGAIVRYEESRGSSILYLEESGGMAAKGATPPLKAGEPAPAKAPRATPPVVARAGALKADRARATPRRGGLPDAVVARQ